MSSSNHDLLLTATREQVPKRHASKIPHYAHLPNMLSSRSLGFNKKQKIGFTDSVVSTLYNSFNITNSTKCNNSFSQYCGGIFNFEFSLDGKLLVAACEGKQVLLYNAGDQKRIKTVENAHDSCVNCIKFLDATTFATGSDDALIKLWDVRNLKSSTKTLHGHSSWVKNIEWSQQEQVMVTSAFDGTVYAWNLNDGTENNFEKVFLMSGLMRMKLTPDGTKMIISTTTGFIIIIHNLNLLSLATDLRSFRPNLYRLMQTSDQSFPVATRYNYLFNPSRTRNRIEFIDDFPNDAEVISSLQVHPHGWSVASRNLNSEENEEWTAVHDIQDRDEKDYKDAFVYVEDCDIESESGTEETSNQRPTDLWMGYISLDDYQNVNWQPRQEMGIVNSGLIGMTAHDTAYFHYHPNEKNKIVKNLTRMTHYVKEKNVGKGFIKGLSFSSDGRIICSPYDKGVRLLAFSESCQEVSECIPESPQQLKTIVEMNDCHADTVVACRFSPTHYQLVTGCLGSEIKWYQPVL